MLSKKYHITSRSPVDPNKSAFPKKIIIKIYWVVAIFGFIISLYIFFSRGLLVSGQTLFNLRYSHTVMNRSTLGADHMSLFGFALSLYYLFKGKNIFSILALVLSSGPVFAFASRTGLFMRLVSFVYLGIWLKRMNFKVVLTCSVAFIILSTVIAFGTNKLIASDGNFFLIGYVGYGFTSFENWILGSSSTFCARPMFGNIFGGIADYVFGNSCADTVGALPGYYNVYTYLETPYLFAGELGVIISMLVFGILYGALFTIAKQNLFFLMMLSSYIYPILMVFFDWQFSLTTYIYLFLIFIPLFSNKIKFFQK